MYQLIRPFVVNGQNFQEILNYFITNRSYNSSVMKHGFICINYAMPGTRKLLRLLNCSPWELLAHSFLLPAALMAHKTLQLLTDFTLLRFLSHLREAAVKYSTPLRPYGSSATAWGWGNCWGVLTKEQVLGAEQQGRVSSFQQLPRKHLTNSMSLNN